MRDNGQPTPRFNTTLLTVTILRNLAPPVFNPVLYSAAVQDTTPLGTVITTVTATDTDTSVSGPMWLLLLMDMVVAMVM